ncbi:MAG: Flp pilus assembly complex ATPase component TadA [Ferruginibacter sp.]|nr:Flp pilus assembly complex ATPase component TadA [Ferruginibacter sp.]
MAVSNPYIKNLLTCINLEEKEQVERYSLDQQHSLKQLKVEGLALHPITVTRKNFGYADYPEISFKLNCPVEINLFKDGAAIECFCVGEEPVKGLLLNLDGRSGECRLFAPDFPDWIEDKNVGIKLAPDQRTTSIMKNTLNNLEANKDLYRLFEEIHGTRPVIKREVDEADQHIVFANKNLNASQQAVVKEMVANHEMLIIHGPPGTGKTTTLIEGILQLIKQGEKIIVTAPSNTAVDNIAKGLIEKGAGVLRVGNSSKTDELVFAHTPEGKLASSREQKEIKQLKIRAEEFSKMALKYKRSFGKEERGQRNLLFKEVKDIRQQIKKLQAYNEEKLFEQADVILGTPIGLYDADLRHLKFNCLVMDEAGQCIEPLAWCVFPLAQKYILAGDHLQLPPTVLSNEGAQLGFNTSILETAAKTMQPVFLLDTQYRMRQPIAGFSNQYFYEGRLKTDEKLLSSAQHVTFIDTAGSGFNEEHGEDGASLKNEGELNIVNKIIETENIDPAQTAFISPYAGQVAAAKDMLPKQMRISTIDSFQGQEHHTIIISLVRSNDDGIIGFLKDYRRMNVALTRAKEQLYVIGDSATLGSDTFFVAFLKYVEAFGYYRTVWEWDL